MGNHLFKKQLRENYIIKDEEADFYKMRGKGPFMVDSFGKKYLKPSLLHGYGYGYQPYSLRDGNFYPRSHVIEPRSDLRYMGRYAWTHSPLAQMQIQTYYDYYHNYVGKRY